MSADRRSAVRHYLADAAGFAGAEAALLACLLGAACIVVGQQLAQGAATAADHVDGEVATGSPDRQGGARPPLAWQVPVGSIPGAAEIQKPPPPTPLALRSSPPVGDVQKNEWQQDRQLLVQALPDNTPDTADHIHVRKPGDIQRLPAELYAHADVQFGKNVLSDKNSMRPDSPAAQPTPKIAGYDIYPIAPRKDALVVLNEDQDPQDALSKQKVGKGGYDLVINGTFTVDREHLKSSGTVIRRGHFDTHGTKPKTSGRGGVAILDDGTIVIGRQNGSEDPDIQREFGAPDHRVDSFVGGGVLLIEGGKQRTLDEVSRDLAGGQKFPGGIDAQQLHSSSHTLIGIKDGQAYVIIANGKDGRQLLRDLTAAGFDSVIKFDGSSGSYVRGGQGPQYNGKDGVGFGVHIR